MKSIQKNIQKILPGEFPENSLVMYLPGGITLDLKNPGQKKQEMSTGFGAQCLDSRAEADALYYPLFPPEEKVKKETYVLVHEKLMKEMRAQVRLKNRRGIERTGKRLHRLRKRYQTRFAA